MNERVDFTFGEVGKYERVYDIWKGEWVDLPKWHTVTDVEMCPKCHKWPVGFHYCE